MLTNTVAELLPQTRRLVLEVSGVEAIDSAGLAELLLVLIWAQGSGCALKLAAPTPRIQQLLELTNLTAVVEIHPTLGAMRCYLFAAMRHEAGLLVFTLEAVSSPALLGEGLGDFQKSARCM